MPLTNDKVAHYRPPGSEPSTTGPFERGALSEDERIIQEAKRRFKRCQEWERDFHACYRDDVKFAWGDSDNGWQWPDKLRRDRISAERPALTINKVIQHVLQITNDGRKNKPAIKVSPSGETVSFDAAQVYEGLCRHIEYTSSAQAIYDDAMESQVEGGIGYWRVVTEYADDRSFDQVIKIAPVRHAMAVYLDCDIKQKDGSDAKYAFIFDEVPTEQFERDFPGIAIDQNSPLFDLADDWTTMDNTRLAEYYRIVTVDDELIEMEDENGVSSTFLRSDVPQRLKKHLEQVESGVKGGAARVLKKRKVKRPKLQWFKIACNQIIDRRDDMPGRYIPVVRLVGRERIVDGRLERKGHVRNIKDAQRMYNYNTSAQVEFGALATKSPWLVAVEAMEGNEPAWNTANTRNAAYLPWKHKDKDGDQIPPPQQPGPPQVSPAFELGLRVSAAEMEMSSGQYAPQQDQPTIERTPAAINARQRTGDTATYHFIDHLAIAVKFTGMIIIDLAPKIYDTNRVVKILAKDGTQTTVKFDPNAQKDYQEKKQGDELEVIFNPTIGQYNVQADIGPAYATQRQEAFNAFVQIVGGAPELVNDIGDLMFLSADFPMADKIAERIKRKIKQVQPWLLDDQEIGPLVQQLKGELDQRTQKVGELLQQLAQTRLELKNRDEKRDIGVYDAQTRRLHTAMESVVNAAKGGNMGALHQVIMKVIGDILGFGLETVEQANQQSLSAYGEQNMLNPEPGEVEPEQMAQQQGQGGPGEASGGGGAQGAPPARRRTRAAPGPRGAPRNTGPPISGARRAKDGNWYLPDRNRPGKYLMVANG